MNQPTLFLHTLRMGQKEGYPPCCVRQFAQDVIAGRKPFMLRRYHLHGGCVPCDLCFEQVKSVLAKGPGLHRTNGMEVLVMEES